MNTQAVGVPVLLIAVILAAVAGYFYIIKKNKRTQPQLRSIPVRIICLTAAVLLLAGLIWGTFSTAGSSYADNKNTVLYSAPSSGPAELKYNKNKQDVDTPHRVAVTMLYIQTRSGQIQPVASDSIEISWPEDRGKTFTSERSFGALKFSSSFRIDRYNFGGKDNAPWPEGSVNIKYKHLGSSGSSGSGWYAPFDKQRFALRTGMLGNGRSLSLFSLSPEYNAGMQMLYFYTPCVPGDSLVKKNAAEFIKDNEMEIRQSFSTAYSSRRKSYHHFSGLFSHIDISLVVLLAAAGLGAQFFRRKGAAFTALVFCMMFFTAAVDRAVLGYHLSHLEQPDRDEGYYSAAVLNSMQQTFFYKRTARLKLRDIAGRKDTSAEIEKAVYGPVGIEIEETLSETPEKPASGVAVILRRTDQFNYKGSAWSFRYRTGDDAVHKNHYDIRYGNCGYIHISGNYSNRLWDLGKMPFENISGYIPLRNTGNTWSVRPEENHTYLFKGGPIDDKQKPILYAFRITKLEKREMEIRWIQLGPAAEPDTYPELRGANGADGFCRGWH